MEKNKQIDELIEESKFRFDRLKQRLDIMAKSEITCDQLMFLYYDVKEVGYAFEKFVTYLKLNESTNEGEGLENLREYKPCPKIELTPEQIKFLKEYAKEEWENKEEVENDV